MTGDEGYMTETHLIKTFRNSYARVISGAEKSLLDDFLATNSINQMADPSQPHHFVSTHQSLSMTSMQDVSM